MQVDVTFGGWGHAAQREKTCCTLTLPDADIFGKQALQNVSLKAFACSGAPHLAMCLCSLGATALLPCFHWHSG